LHSALFVPHLAEAREQQCTQAEIATLAGLSIPTVRNLERGRGSQASLLKMLTVLSLRIEGRNLPPGKTLGKRLALLRKRRGFTQAELADEVNVAQETVNRLEGADLSSLATLDRVFSFLGAGPYLAPEKAVAAFYTHAGNSSVNQAWATPAALLASLYAALGTFDLDPCSPTADRRKAPVRARMYLTAMDDGLTLPWRGKVFMNPPYGRALKQWVSKAHSEVQAGRARLVAALVPARTETLWWHTHIAGVADAFMLRGRLSFGNATPAPFPSALILWGASAEQVAAVRQQFPTAWHVPKGDRAAE
jgi:phage N-6-adenine-methyltransferase